MMEDSKKTISGCHRCGRHALAHTAKQSGGGRYPWPCPPYLHSSTRRASQQSSNPGCHPGQQPNTWVVYKHTGGAHTGCQYGMKTKFSLILLFMHHPVLTRARGGRHDHAQI